MDQLVSNAIVSRVEIDSLFGYLDHRLDFDREPRHDQNMNLLYGENGCGKTTILRLIYASMSPNRTEGLRSYIAAVPFRRFFIKTQSGAAIEITREAPEKGSYRFAITPTPTSGTISAEVKVDDSLRVSVAEIPELDKVTEEIAKLKIDLLFLSDDRQLRTTLPFMRILPDRVRPRSVRREVDEQPESLDRVARGEAERNWLDLSIVAANLLDNFRREVFERGDSGQRNANTIYLDLLKRLASAWSAEGAQLDYDFNRAIEELKELEERAAPLLTLGAIASVPFSEFRETLRLAPASRQQDLLRILQPFLESTKARIDALAPIANVLTLLLDMLNGYLARKSVTFNVRNGFELSTPITHSLPLAALSSGEKHLFLLLCSAFLSRQRTCLFLVDEPELSLNVYWQRKLPRTLQQLIEGTPVQYILATHSLEILTEFNHRINQLSA